MRGAIGNLRAAAETLELYPGVSAERRARLFAVLAEESARLARQIESIEELAAVERSGDPGRERDSGTLDRLLARLAATARAAGLECEIEPVAPPEGGAIHVAADLEHLITATAGLLAELRGDLAVSRCRLSARAVESYVLLDISWRPPAEEVERLLAWRSEALEIVAPADGSAPRSSLRGAARELDGEAWFNLDRDGGAARVRILLPATEPVAAGRG